MAKLQLLSLAAASLLRLCAGQTSGWIDGQVNTTMCYWQQPRAAAIRDTTYIDGGSLYWQPGLKDGTYAPPVSDGNPAGDVYLLNFSIPFKTSDNISSILTTISKASGGGNANNIGPNYVDGGMFANDYEWITYGGLVTLTDAFAAQSSSAAAAYEKYDNRNAPQFAPSYIVKTIGNGISRYLTYGATASAPSENLGFYFSGMRSSTFGTIYGGISSDNATLNADVISNTLITIDMTTESAETWSNTTLPTNVPGRASAEIVWVPISEKGILVAIGGAISPSYSNINQTNNATTNQANKDQNPNFTSTVAVYDIANGKWYEQPTSGSGPGALVQGCTVLASAEDGSSHNIYWYGGFDGIDSSGDFNDQVYVLSIPSFMWMPVSTGQTSHGRAGHRCVKPYPDQMFVIGGYASFSGSNYPLCLEGGIIQIFNLSSTEWIDSYSPNVWSNYQVPKSITDMIGGTPNGSATETAPSSTGFTSPSMTALFGTKYNTSKIVDWYPYHLQKAVPPANTTVPPGTTVNKSSGTPSYLAPVLAVVLGLFFITLIVLIVMLWRRRRYLKSQPAASEAGTMDNKFWVTNWLRSTPQDHKAQTVTTDDTEITPMTPYDDVYTDTNRSEVPEVGGTQVHELMDTSVPVELHDTGFVPLGGHQTSNASNRNRNRNRGLTSSPSVASHESRASTVSRDSHSPIDVRPPISPIMPRPDSPSLGDQRILSGVSNISESDRGHLRGISEASISTDGNYATPMGEHGLLLQNLPPRHTEPGVAPRPVVVSPLTPPEGVERSGDYMTAGSSKRKSNFNEELDK